MLMEHESDGSLI